MENTKKCINNVATSSVTKVKSSVSFKIITCAILGVLHKLPIFIFFHGDLETHATYPQGVIHII